MSNYLHICKSKLYRNVWFVSNPNVSYTLIVIISAAQIRLLTQTFV